MITTGILNPHQAPMCVDILNSNVLGAKPLATCAAGTSPKQNCSTGVTFAGAPTCHAGAGDSQKCNQGSGVVSICSAGTTV
jgi:hypothetical protein